MKLIAAPNTKKILRAVISRGRLDFANVLPGIEHDNTTQAGGVHVFGDVETTPISPSRRQEISSNKFLFE